MAALRRAEIDAAGKFAHAQHVETISDEFLFHRRGVGEGRQADTRTEVGEKAEMLAQRQQRTALRLDVRREVLPFRSADRAEENGVRLFRGGYRFRRQRVARGIDRRAADEVLRAGNREAEFGFHGVENADGLGHDFGANAVSGEDRDAVLA